MVTSTATPPPVLLFINQSVTRGGNGWSDQSEPPHLLDDQGRRPVADQLDRRHHRRLIPRQGGVTTSVPSGAKPIPGLGRDPASNSAPAPTPSATDDTVGEVPVPAP